MLKSILAFDLDNYKKTQKLANQSIHKSIICMTLTFGNLLLEAEKVPHR
jgi:hypothetical protein